MASLYVLFCKCLPNLYTVLFNCIYYIQFGISKNRSDVQMRRHFIPVISDIVSFHSERLEHLAIHFNYFDCESCQLCMSMECNIFLLVLCEYH